MRHFSAREYEHQLESSRINVKKSLEKYDRSAFILSAYVPLPARDCYCAIRSFNLEISKISKKNNHANIGGLSSVDLKFKFWSDYLHRIFKDPFSNEKITEPTMFLIRDGLRNGLNLNVQYFETFINSRKHWLNNPIFQDIDSMCSLGEGTSSQLHYLEQGMLLSPDISPSAIALLEESSNLQSLVSDVAAHIGQANAIAGNLLSLKYFAKQEYIPLPIDVMAEYDVSQDEVIEHITALNQDKKYRNREFEDKLKNVTFKVATRANDHMLASRYKLQQIKDEISDIRKKTSSSLIQKHSKAWKGGVPDVIFVPFMNSIPVDIFLTNLQKKDFNVLDERLLNSSMNRWKVVWKSFYNYNRRVI